MAGERMMEEAHTASAVREIAGLDLVEGSSSAGSPTEEAHIDVALFCLSALILMFGSNRLAYLEFLEVLQFMLSA